jgi:hypothetical protein
MKDFNYYKEQLKRINSSSKVITIKISDYEGNETKYFSLNNRESLKEMKLFLELIEVELNAKGE